MSPRKFVRRGKRKRKAFYEYMTPRFWRIHFLIPSTIGLFSLGIALGIAHYTSFQPQSALAAPSYAVTGWAWAPTIGWISLSSSNPGACSVPPCGTYGVYTDVAVSAQPGGNGHVLNGFAWSDAVGFICFGNSCTAAPCNAGDTPNQGYYAFLEEVNDATPKEVHGYAVICNQGDKGWISLNCADQVVAGDPSSISCPGGPSDRLFRIAYDPVSFRFYHVASTGSSFGWNSGTDGGGIGYINFYPDPLIGFGMEFEGLAENTVARCSDGLDNDLNGTKDCGGDPACFLSGSCSEDCLSPGDDDGDGFINCSDSDCSTHASCPEDCFNGTDDDADGDIDCSDSECFGELICLAGPSEADCLSPPACAALVGDAKANCCCSDGTDNNFLNGIDCADITCRQSAPICSAYSRVEAGDVYAGQGIEGGAQSNATYCLRSSGSVEWTSDIACQHENIDTLTLPSYESGYRNKLGFLDLQSIRAGRYGTLVQISNESQISTQMNNSVFRYTGPADFHLSSKTFLNGSGSRDSGAGLLLVDGADLYIDGDLQYTADPVQDRLRNLASFGVIVTKDSGGNGGNVYIHQDVTRVSGAYFVEGDLYTGSDPGAGVIDPYLTLYGIFVAKRFYLERENNTDPDIPAEAFIFDGRSVVNPPPGMQDLSRSLPRPLDTAF